MGHVTSCWEHLRLLFAPTPTPSSLSSPQAAFGSGYGAYVLRCVGFVLSNLILLVIVAPVFLYFVIRAGGLFDGAGWRAFARSHFGGPAFPGGPPVGRIRRIRPLWRDFFRRDFHPWDHDDSAYLKLLTPPPGPNPVAAK